MRFDADTHTIIGSSGRLAIPHCDQVTRKLCMLIEGECEGLGPTHAAEKYGYSRQRYTQVRAAIAEGGSAALMNKTTGPKSNYRRTDEAVRQVIRHRFLDPLASAEVIAQRLRQTQFPISTRSVERVIADFGLQEKTLRLPSSPSK